MSDSHLAEVLAYASERLGKERRPLLDFMAERCINLEWYLKKKIIEAPDGEEMLDHVSVLQYAYDFCLSGAQVTLLQERADVKTPDLVVEPKGLGCAFYMEVRKFRLHAGSVRHPVSKIVDAVTSKRDQLPRSEVGFIAIANFDMRLEAALSHEHIIAALRELERAADDNPSGWNSPSGVILAACTQGGVFKTAKDESFPHFIWINSHSRPAVPSRLPEWLSSSLPDGIIFDASADGSAIPDALS